VKENRRRIILFAAACGAVIGARLASGRIHVALPWDEAMLAHPGFLAACAAVLVLFSVYWEVAALSAAPAKNSESRFSRAVHVFLVNIAMLLVLAPIRGVGRFLPVSTAIMSSGLAVMAAGTVLAIWARVYLGRNWSGEIAIKVEHQLIRSGPYRVLRHPIYTGLLAMYVGPAIVTGEWLAVIGVVMAGLAYWRKIRLEEAALDAAFGPDYDAYRRATWALVPGLF
jgi:protein-S-isoprenylcysteine O-methyltransferase Ste14